MHRWSTAAAARSLVLCAALGAAPTVAAQTDRASLDTRALYEKHEYRIPMRDGVRLYTAVYVPKDTSGRYPFLIYRTRYGAGHYGANDFHPSLGPGVDWRRDPYIFVLQDVRGSFMSEGTFVDMTPHIDHKSSSADVDQSSDT